MLTRYANLYNFSFNNLKKKIILQLTMQKFTPKKKKNQNDEGLKSV